jgi:hypothetical protein
VVSYQGEVKVGEAPYSGDGYFKFAVINEAGDTTYWSNDGSSTGGAEPGAGVEIEVSEGLFSVLLGDTTLPAGMTQALTTDVFSGPDRYLRIWFSTSAGGLYERLTPDTRIAAVPYALQAEEAANADTVDGLHASDLRADYENVVIVAKSGGDYQSVQAAIDSVSGAAADNAYLVWVAPGVYSETVTMKPFVHVQGAGQEATVITSTASGSAWPAQATLVLTRDTSLRDLTVGNAGTGDSSAALLATAGVTRTLAADVTARAQGGGGSNYAIVLSGSDVGVTLRQVTVLAENGGPGNTGLLNELGAATLYGGTYIGRGGGVVYGISNIGSGARLEAETITVLGEDGSSYSAGLYNSYAAAVLSGGAFTARGGTQAHSIYSSGISATLHAESVIALAENGSTNYGMFNYNDAAAVLLGGAFTARGGSEAHAILNSGSDTTLYAQGVTALAETGGTTSGLLNEDGATARLCEASFTGRAGAYARGIYNWTSGTTLEAENTIALGENGTSENYGLYNYDGAAAVLYGGSLIGRGGTEAYGIYSSVGGASLEAESVAALGENGSGTNYGLHNHATAVATLRGASFVGRGGTDTNGIYNTGAGTRLEAEGVIALGEDGTNDNYGLSNSLAAATLRGGSFTGRGGTNTRGMFASTGTTLEAESATAQGEDGSNVNAGLFNEDGAATTLQGGAFTGRGGTHANGINNTGSGTSLEATDVSVLGENGSNNNNGLRNYYTAAAALHGGTFIGRGGTNARGLFVLGDAGVLAAEKVTALGEDGSSANYGLVSSSNGGTTNVTQSVLEGATNSVYRTGGDVTVSNSRLAGVGVSGPVTCTLVTRGTTVSTDGSTCP